MKKRLDILVYEKGFTDSREKAKAIIMSGQVYVDNQKADKCGTSYDENVKIEVRGNTQKYVSRGGLKLEKAIDNFDFDLKDKITMDIGASTGGFTDCMLQNGAKKVYSIDVGYGQLAWKLRQDERVVSMEKTNIRYVTPEDIADPIAFFSVDVAFISLKKVLEPVKALLTPDGQGVCLVKPQFEAGREKVGKKGVVRDPKVHIEVLEQIMQYVLSIGFAIRELSFSPIKGPEGNIEYLLYINNTASAPEEPVSDEAFQEEYAALIRETVAAAHGKLDKEAGAVEHVNAVTG